MAEYEYRGQMAELWDFFRGDTSAWPDRKFYLELIEREGQPVLDVGCGTGRLLLDYLQLGIDIEGVDNSPEMLALCTAKGAALGLAPRLHLQPVEALELPRRSRVILVPSSSIQLLTVPEAADATMRRLHAQLLPGGALAASVMAIWRTGSPLDSGWQLSAERVREGDGALLRRWSRSVYDPTTECESTEDRYVLLVEGVVVESEAHSRAPATRNYTQAQARALFARAGFDDITLYSGFTHAPAAAEDSLFVVVGRKHA